MKSIYEKEPTEYLDPCVTYLKFVTLTTFKRADVDNTVNISKVYKVKNARK